MPLCHGMAIIATLAALLVALVLGSQAVAVARGGWSHTTVAQQPEKEQPLALHRSSGDAGDADSAGDSRNTGSPSSPPYEVRSSPGKGLGLFATRRIPKHARVLVEAPQFVIVPPERPSSSTSSSSSDSSLEAIRDRSADMLSRIRAGFDSLAPIDQALYEACHEHRFPGEPGAGRLFYIFRSNAYSITPFTDMRRQRKQTTRWGMFPLMARINHSCRPNVANLWVPPSSGDDRDANFAGGHHVVWATRDIAPGEEILISYINLLQDTARRQRSLCQYGFQCACPACSQMLDDGGYDDKHRRHNNIADEQRARAGEMLPDIQQFLGDDDGGAKWADEGRVLGHIDEAEKLIRYLRDEAGSDGGPRHQGENGGLEGYLPRAYRLFAELGRRAAANGIDGQKLRAWLALMQQILPDKEHKD